MTFAIVFLSTVFICFALGGLIGWWLCGPRLDKDTDDWINRKGKYK